METYFVQGNGHACFVKLGASIERYLAMAETGLTPPILAFGQLESGPSILVQPLIPGRTPARIDFQNRLADVASIVHGMHHNLQVRQALPPVCSNSHREAGQQALEHLRSRWGRHKERVPEAASFVEKSLEDLAAQIGQFSSEGLSVCHNDICNANWIFASDGKIYIIDLDSMSLEDPAADMGALLWWYYPPPQRQKFLDIAGYRYDQDFQTRMRVRMAIHCLSITLPREQSFESFDSGRFHMFLTDFKAVLDGRENPQGYTD